jgi:hypothetical protein
MVGGQGTGAEGRGMGARDRGRDVGNLQNLP